MAIANLPVVEYKSPRNRQTDEALLAVFDIYRFSRQQLEQIRVSPDNRHIAFIDQAGGEWSRVTVDQEAGPLFPGILLDSLTFSDDSQRFAYAATDARGQYVLIDDNQLGPYSCVISCSPAFSPDSQQVAYAVHFEGKHTVSVFIDEDLLCTCDKIGDTLQFSPDGTSLAFKAAVGGKQCVMVNGRRGPLYDQVDNPHFSPDSHRMAYTAEQDGQWFIVVDGEEGQHFKNAVRPLFSPDSERFAYYAQRDDGWYLVVDDQLIGPYHKLEGEFGLFRYSPDSNRFAFVGVEAKKWFMISYGHKGFVVIDGEQGRKYDWCGGLVFSPNSQHLAYAAQRGKQWFIVLDGQEFGPYEAVEEDGPCFSPDSRQLGYAAAKSGRWSPYINGRPVGKYDLAWKPTFDPDSRSYAAVIHRKGKGAGVAINGDVGGNYYDGVFIKRGGARIVFNSPNSLHYIASPKNAPDHWYLVTESFSS